MAQPTDHNSTPEQYEETHDARNPPNSVLHPQVRRTARWSFLTPVIVLAIIAGLLWIYWSRQPAQPREALQLDNHNEMVGTSGERTPGGINTEPSFGSTQDELKFRGVDGGKLK